MFNSFKRSAVKLEWVEFEITANCNACLFKNGFTNSNGEYYPSACKYCYQRENQALSKVQWQQKELSQLDTVSLKNIFNDMKELDIKRACILGGEPFLRPDIIELLNFAYKTIGYVQCVTNAFNILTVADKLENCHSMNISIDSHIPEIAYKTRPRPLVDKAIEAFKVLPKKDIFTVINAVLTKYNYDTIFDFIKFAFDCGVKNFNIYCLMKYADESLVIKQSELNKLFEKINASFEIDLQTHCKGGRHIYIEANGNVMPCAGFISKNESIGNLKNSSLKKILSSDKFLLLSQCDFKSSANKIEDFSNENGCLAINYWQNLDESPKSNNLTKGKYCLRCNKIELEVACPRCGYEKFGDCSTRMACHEIAIFPK
jgi:MoaA/NifB/PqqE/SkfB family radical SAM enzyme